MAQSSYGPRLATLGRGSRIYLHESFNLVLLQSERIGKLHKLRLSAKLLARGNTNPTLPCFLKNVVNKQLAVCGVYAPCEEPEDTIEAAAAVGNVAQ